MRLYVACLASYNNGVLHGRWIDASSDVDEMQEEIAAMLRESRFPNVSVKCPHCEGTGKVTFHNSETGAIREDTCFECAGAGKVASAEEWAIHDSEGLPRCFGEYPGLEKIAAFVELAEEFDHLDAEDVATIVDHFGGLEYAETEMRDHFAGVYDSFRSYADEIADEALAGLDPESIAVRYFDYESYARDLKHDMTIVEISTGLALFWP
ncbi:antirestriction protein ArdA [Neorhizobium galegae]|uniref:Antirestriction protein ArdA n=1 Tax=Neorhizobium galegae bv. orientalis str. HAMBI 540 TaxID=1028800 RepID=A0A068SP02_NEOGA|nr:antirestriction protein ArdA [Neorhizobium galegae]CDN47584.1 Antirestriction protein ArdA [Neorhizobium galegae bv. orientalis str. HAMBI 540]